MKDEKMDNQFKNENKDTRIYIRTIVDKSHTSKAEHDNLKSYINILKIFPFMFLLIFVLFLVGLFFLLKTTVSVYILLAIFILLLVREISTLLFVNRMKSNVMSPLQKLQRGVEEVSDGNYGFVVRNDEVTPISPLIDSFNTMSSQLKEIKDTNEKYELNRKKLLAGISHDLKTPITSILGYVEGINEGVANSPEKMSTYMDIIYKNAKYTNTLIDDLFLFSKLDINQIKYQIEKVSVKDYFDDIFIEKKIDLEERGHKVSYMSGVTADMQMYFDPKMIYRVISNLISNAIKYNDKEQLILYCKIEELEDRKGIRVTVKDNGIGIEENEIDNIFDVFYRVDKARNKDVGGSGLGLSISRQLVEAHDGEIKASSKLGEGTTFTFTIYDQKNKM